MRRDQPALDVLQARQRSLARIYEANGEATFFVQGLKCAMSQLGLCEDLLVEPFPRLGPANRERIASILGELGLLTSAAPRSY